MAVSHPSPEVTGSGNLELHAGPPGAGLGCPVGRAALARERARLARTELASCHFCEHHCGADRRQGERGLCQAGPRGRVFCAQVEVSDELEFVPVFAIALSGCDLRCDFCITGAQSWHAQAGRLLAPEELGQQAEAALAAGARTVMILGGEPTIHLPTALEIVAALPGHAPLIWKTNGHGSPQARALLDGMFDLWLVDYKFGNDQCARRLAGYSNYGRAVRDNLLWANRHSEAVVRHLLMPGHVDCCWQPVAQWLAHALPDVKVNLRAGFWPAWQTARHPDLLQGLSAADTARAWAIAQEYGLNLIE